MLSAVPVETMVFGLVSRHVTITVPLSLWVGGGLKGHVPGIKKDPGKPTGQEVTRAPQEVPPDSQISEGVPGVHTCLSPILSFSGVPGPQEFRTGKKGNTAGKGRGGSGECEKEDPGGSVLGRVGNPRWPSPNRRGTALLQGHLSTARAF